MSITLIETISALRNGQQLEWKSSGQFKAGKIVLETARQRRLFSHLISLDSKKVAITDEILFEGIIAAWSDTKIDPVDSVQESIPDKRSGPWCLSKIESTGFGGLNCPDGPKFGLTVDSENWCIEGYNGSGKTSLASLIIWTMTGYRIREQEGLRLDDGRREPVTNEKGNNIGSWPPLIAYPETPEGLKEAAVVECTLTFVDPAGNKALAYRKVSSPVEGEPTVTAIVDPVLSMSPELIETGLLMPARIGHIGFGEKSKDLYQAIRMLTGLDQLSDLATGAGNLMHKSKRFLKYAKDMGADQLEEAFEKCIREAREIAENTSISLDPNYLLKADNLAERLTSLETDASEKARKVLAVVKTEIAASFNFEDPRERNRLIVAVKKARDDIDEGPKGLPFFNVLTTLEKAYREVFSEVGTGVVESEVSLDRALEWHSKQESDHRLRLKALASKFFVTEEMVEEVATCPLCDTKLTSVAQKELAEELSVLKKNADVAGREIADACGDIKRKLTERIPDYFLSVCSDLAMISPRADFLNALKARFADRSPYRDILIGMAKLVEDTANDAKQNLPEFMPKAQPYTESEIPEVKQLQSYMLDLKRILALGAWWAEHRSFFIDSWNGLIGKSDEQGKWPAGSLEGKIEALEDAVEGVRPLDKIAKLANEAKLSAVKWQGIFDVQTIREEIAKDVKPLKDLQNLVDCESHRTIETLSGRVSSILDDIWCNERFSFNEAFLSKKTVSVHASFEAGMKVDATLVANSSWLCALLWAFVFALREQAVRKAQSCKFPLMVLDDPQATFDPRNLRSWASKIVELANSDVSKLEGMQLFLTTHDPNFFYVICEVSGLIGRQGKIAGPSKSSEVAHIVNGTILERFFEKADQDKNDEDGFTYVQQVRIYCESLLKIMLRPEAVDLHRDTVGNLLQRLAQLRDSHIPPYNRPPFGRLIRSLDPSTSKKSKEFLQVINDTHHNFDGTIGYTEALKVNSYWKSNVENAFSKAFDLASDFDAYGGVTRLFDWPDNVIQFPNGNEDRVKLLGFDRTGYVAAAGTEGIVTGGGQIFIEESDETQTFTLSEHSAYRLTANTLNPIADVGDVILVHNSNNPATFNLVVGIYGEKLYARRLNETEEHNDLFMLTGQTTDPYSLPTPVIAPKDKIDLRKIIGTVFFPEAVPPPPSQHELSEVGVFGLVEDRLKNVRLLQVKGRSMEPIALDGQYLMTRDEVFETSNLNKLDGQLVIASDDEDRIYFKRLRLHADTIVLESTNSSRSTSSEILSLYEGGKFPRLVSLRSVVGVLFDPPVAN